MTTATSFNPELEAGDPMVRLMRIKGLAHTAPIAVDTDDMLFLKHADPDEWSRVVALQRAAGWTEHRGVGSMTEAEEMAEAVANAISIATAPLHKRIGELEKKVAGLESRPAMQDKGTWQDGRWYEPGSVVSYQGSAWVTNTRTNAVPGTPDAASRAWRLMVKKGRDGKDLR